jgi:hypothetical protein
MLQPTEKAPTGNPQAVHADKPPAPSCGLLYITRAYNRGEMTFDEWLILSREWAEHIIQQHTKPAPS